MKSLTHEDVNNLTLMSLSNGTLVAVDSKDKMIHVGMVIPEFAHMVGASVRMYNILTDVIKGNEGLLEMIEAEGLDKSAYHLTDLIAALKLVQKSAIDGPSVLTAIKPTSN